MELETVLDEFTDTKLMDAALILELEMHMRGIYEDEPPLIPGSVPYISVTGLGCKEPVKIPAQQIPGLKESVQAFKLFDEVKVEKLVKPRDAANANLDLMFFLILSALFSIIVVSFVYLIRGVW
jgi:hypothetical protein